LPCAVVFAAGQRATEIVGPLLEDEAAQLQSGFLEGARVGAGGLGRARLVCSSNSAGFDWDRSAGSLSRYWCLLTGRFAGAMTFGLNKEEFARAERIEGRNLAVLS
jgi:hypothetical protein